MSTKSTCIKLSGVVRVQIVPYLQLYRDKLFPVRAVYHTTIKSHNQTHLIRTEHHRRYGLFNLRHWGCMHDT